MKRLASAPLAAVLLALAGCGQPRSVSFFQAHPDEMAQAVQRCNAGGTRGQECANADQAAQLSQARRSDAAMESWGKSLQQPGKK